MGKFLRMVVPVATLALTTGPAAPSSAAAPNSCLFTAKAAVRACALAAHADGELASGKCGNLPLGFARNACNRNASTDRKDALAECKEEKDLRKNACKRLGPAPYVPTVDPQNFTNSTKIDNPYFPLVPGTTFVYEGQTADGFEHVEFAVTHTTRMILNVECVEVHDTLSLDNKVAEDTRDWFAQDNEGNVWYFGENTALIEDGLPVDLSGTWTGGADGAQVGLVMKAHPEIGDFYRQEFLLGEAEDLAEVKSLTESVTVALPPGSFTDCLETEESTPLALGDIEHKFYAKGIGNVLTIDMEPTPPERSELIQIIREP